MDADRNAAAAVGAAAGPDQAAAAPVEWSRGYCDFAAANAPVSVMPPDLLLNEEDDDVDQFEHQHQHQHQHQHLHQHQHQFAVEWPLSLADLADTNRRYAAIIELCKKSDIMPDLAVVLWCTPGVLALLLMETVRLYPEIHPPNLNSRGVHLLCSVAALKQRLVIDRRTRQPFLESGALRLFFPYLGIVGKTRDTEHLRICTLSLILTVCQRQESDPQQLLLHLQPTRGDLLRLTIFCLSECISEVGRSMALKILMSFLGCDEVLSYLCHSYDRFRELLWAMGRLVIRLERKFLADFSDQSKRVFKYVITTFIRICDNDLGREALMHCVPVELFDGRFCAIFANDEHVERWLQQLHARIYGCSAASVSSMAKLSLSPPLSEDANNNNNTSNNSNSNNNTSNNSGSNCSSNSNRKCDEEDSDSQMGDPGSHYSRCHASSGLPLGPSINSSPDPLFLVAGLRHN